MYKLYFILFFVPFFYSCNPNNNQSSNRTEFHLVQKHVTDSSFELLPFQVAKKIVSKGNDTPVLNNDLIEANIVVKFIDGTAITSQARSAQLTRIKVGIKQVLVGLDLALATMHEKEKAVFIMPPSLAYGNTQQGIIDPNTTLRYEVYIDRVFKAFTPSPFVIDSLSEKSLGDGIKMWWAKKTNDSLIAPKQVLRLHYSLYTNDGHLVESTHTDGPPIVGEIGVGLHPSAWELALPHVKVGEQVRVFVPWQKAFGITGKPPHIAPKTDVFYDLYPIQNNFIPF